MKKALFITNIPSPYRVDFFNELSSCVDLTVVFEARRARGMKFNWNDDDARFNAVYLDDVMNERKVNRKIFQYIEKGRYDYVFFSNYAYFTELAGLIKAKIIGLPYILELDGAICKKEGFLKRMVKSMIIRGAARYFSPNSLTDDVLAHYGVRRENIVRYPFSSVREREIREKPATAEEKKRIREQLGIHEEKMALCVGQFIRRKGMDVLIRASAKLPDSTGVYCVGGNPTREYLKLVEDLNLSNVHFIGFQNEETLRRYYDAADLFVLPTREDIWGLVVNEAMARGLPVITTDNCGAGLELIKDNGKIVKVGEVDELSRAMENIVTNAECLNEMARKSLEIIRDYTIESMARKHIKFMG